MGMLLRLLMVEDSEDDAELLLYTLRRGGYEVISQRVDTPAAMRSALMEGTWDIITSDHAMPRFNAPAALKLARELSPEIPLIIVSGEIDLNLAVLLMKGGAQDYIQKSELARVVPAIERELSDAANRRRQRETEEILYRQQLLMARIYDTSPVGITMVDLSGQITFANREAERVLGLTKDTITQLTYNAPGWHITNFDGSPFPDEELPFVRVMRTGQPVRDVHHAIEWPDGRRILLSINAAPLTDDTGTLNGMVATLHDITNQVMVAESLHASEARFRTLVTSMDDIIFTLDSQGRHTGVFGSWIEKFGLVPEYFLGRTACEIMGMEAGCIHEAACQRAILGATEVYDWEAILADGDKRYYQTSLSPIYDGEHVIGVVGVGRDVTERKRVEQALRVREAQLHAALENTPNVAVQWYDREGRVVYWNRASERMYGWSAVEAVGKTLDQLLYTSEENAAFIANLQSIAETGQVVELYESTFCRRDGSVGIILSTQFALPSDAERPLFACVDVDISALKLSEEKFAKAFYASPMAMTITTIADGRYIDVNDAFLKSTGYTRPEVINQTNQALNIIVHAQDRERAQHEMDERGRVDNLEMQVRRKNGELRIGLFSASPVCIGTELCWLATMLDITESKRAEQELREAQKQYQDLVETAQDLIWQCDSDGRYTYLNPAWEAVLGYSLHEMLGRKFTDFQMSATAQRDLAEFAGLLTGGMVKGYETIHQAKDGHSVSLAFNAKCVRDETGNIIGTRGTAHDVTEQKCFVKALQDSERRFHQFMRHFPGLAYIKDAEMRSLYASEGFLSYLGLDPTYIVGKTNDELFPPEFAEKLNADDQFVLHTGQSIEIEEQFAGKLWSTHKFLIPQGENLPILGGVTIDITERRRTERERDRIFNYSMEMLCIVDSRGCFRLLNPAWEKTLGWTMDEMLGHHYLDFVHPDDHSTTRQVADGQMQGEDIVRFENRYHCKDGSYKWLSWNSVAVDEGQEVFAVARDVTDQKITSEALRNSEERYRRLFETMQTGFALHEIVCDESGEPVDYRFLEINPAFEQLTGLKASELLGKTVLEVMPGTEHYWIETYGKVALTGEPDHVYSYATELKKYYEGVAYCPKIGQFAVLFSDVSERKAMELALRQSEERYRTLVEHSPDAIAVHSGGEVQYANPAAMLLLRAEKIEQLVGQRALRFVHPDQRAVVFERIQRMMTTGEPAPLADEKFIRLDGSVVDVEVASIPTIYDGKPAAQVIFREITRRKQAEVALLQSEQRFRRTFDEAPLGALLASPRMDFLRVNHTFCQWLGYTEAELLQMNMVAITHPDDRQASKETAHALLEGTVEQVEMEKRYIRKDGVAVWGRVSVALLRDDAGNPLYFLPMIQDITRSKQAEQEIRQMNVDLEQRVHQRTIELEAANRELEKTNRELESFTYSVSHDLRAPLRGIDGFSKILLESYCDSLDEDGVRYLTRLRESAQWMSQLVTGLLDLSRFSRAHMSFDQVNLSELAQSIVSNLCENEPERNVDVTIQPDLLQRCDAPLMRVVLDNLLRNAWKFTSKLPRAQIRFGRDNQSGEAVYFVRDNGAGFDMAYADKLFIAFQRLHTEEDFEGTGIGLAIVQRIIHRHGGHIWAEGIPNQGATFYFSLA